MVAISLGVSTGLVLLLIVLVVVAVFILRVCLHRLNRKGKGEYRVILTAHGAVHRMLSE